MTIDYGMDMNETDRSPQGFFPTNIQLPSTFGNNGVWQGVPIDSIDFDPMLANKVITIVEQAFTSPDPLKYEVPRDLTVGCGNEIKRFICALDGYHNSPNPIMPLGTLIEGLRDYDFAKYLKKLRTALFTRKYGLVSVAEDDLDKLLEESGLDYNKFVDIGDIFYYKYWFKWTETSNDDWKHSLIPVRVKEGMEDKFREALRRILPETCAPVVKDEVLLSITASSCISSRNPMGSKSKVYKEKEHAEVNTFSAEPLKGYFTEVYKCPTEVREAVTLTVPQSNTVKWIEKQFAVIAAKLPTSNYGKTKEDFKKDLEAFWKNNKYFLNRDLTKEGWTKPRWMLRVIKEECMKKYPNCEAFRYMTIYDKFDLVKDGVTYPTNRGHGLGMANCLTTIMQCAVFELIVFERGEMIEEPDALFYNDDGTIGAQDEDSIIAYTEHEDQILEDLGLLRKDKKTYAGKVSVLCERYSIPELNEKASYTEYIRRIPFSAPCLISAKNQAYLCTDPSFGRVDLGLIGRLVRFFGYEYDPEEYKLPHWAGGWQILTYKNVDLTFMEEPRVHPQLLARGFSVGPPKLKPEVYSKAKGFFTNPAEYLYPTADMDERVLEAFMIRQPRKKVLAKFSKGAKKDSLEHWLIAESVRRKKLWFTPQKEESMAFYWKTFVDRNPWVDAIPPESCLKLRHISEVTGYCPHKKYPAGPKQPNPILGSISYFSDKYIRHCIPVPYIPGRIHERTSISQDRLDKFQESVLNIPDVSKIIIGKPREMTYSVLKKRRWNSDYDVIDAYATATGEMNVYPEPIHLSLGGTINKEYEFYTYFMEYAGNELYWEWWVTYGRTIPFLLMNRTITFEDVEEMLGLDILSKPDEPEEVEIPVDDWDNSVDFWMWKANNDLRPHPGRLQIYISVNQLLMASNVIYGAPELISREEQRLELERSTGIRTERPVHLQTLLDLVQRGVPTEGSPLDKIYKNVTGVMGRYLFGVYHYRPPEHDVFGTEGSDSDSEGEGFMDSLW